jgi:hypothetical protein
MRFVVLRVENTDMSQEPMKLAVHQYYRQLHEMYVSKRDVPPQFKHEIEAVKKIL